jgi:endonuclease I
MKSFLHKTTALLIALIWSIAALGQESVIYTTGFEAAEGFTAGTVYNNTTIKYDGPVGQQWGTYYGTASTTGAISGLMSMQMRFYTANPANLGYTFMNFDLTNVTKVTFRALNTSGNNVRVSYSTDEGTSYVGETLFNLTTSAVEYTYNISPTGEFANVRVRFMLSVPVTPVNATRITIDDIAVYGITGGGSQVETPTFSPASGSYYSPINVSINTGTDGATIFYSTTSNTGPWTTYSTAINVSANTTIWSYAAKTGMDDSNVATAVYNFPTVVDVANISALRSGLTDGTVYRLTGEAILTYQQTFRNKKWIQDANAGIEIDDLGQVITTTYQINDGITGIIGTLARTNNMLEFKPVANTSAASSVGNTPVIITRTLASLTEADQARLVKINDIYFDLMYSGMNFATGTNYTIDDPSGFGVFRTEFWEADYITTPIPMDIQNIVAIVRDYNSVFQITARSLNDFNTFSNDATLSTFSLSGQSVLALPGLLVNNPITDPGATLAVSDFTGFQGVIATATHPSATVELTRNGSIVLPANYATQPFYDGDIVIATVTAEDSSVAYYKVTLNQSVEEDTLFAYWNFNDNVPATDTNWGSPILATTGTGQITYTFTQAYSYAGTTINGIDGEVNGGSFCPRGGVGIENNGAYFTIAVPTTGHENIKIIYPTRRTSTGFTHHEIQYTVNGTDWIVKETFDITAFQNNWVASQLITIDFAGIATVNNNPNFAVRIILSGAGGETGNNRIDNIRVASSTVVADSNANLSAFTIGGANALALSNVVVNDPVSDPGAVLPVTDFTGFAGIVATPASASASRVVTINGTPIAEGNLPTQSISQNDVIVVTVTAENGITTKYYKVTAVLSTGTPEIATSGTLLNYKNVYINNVSNVQFYYVSATDLVSDLTITAPAHFLVSLNCNSGFASSLTITPTLGGISTTRVYIRFSPTSLGAKSGNITNSASGAVNVNIAASGTGISTQIPAGYYSTATGIEQQLITQLHNIVRGHSRVSYASIWNHFTTTDAKYNGKVWDNYSDIQCSEPPYEFTFVVNQDTGESATVEGLYYNREHSWPASWWGGSDTDTMYTDLHQVYPADKWVNAKRDNWPYGKVNSPSWTSLNGSKLGNNSYGTGYSGTAFEPIDEYKGDFARTYFYMVTRYNSRLANWATNPNVEYVIDGTSFPAFEVWALDMLLEWHNNDPVSQKEIDRNNAIYALQGNRNPYIDNPTFVDMIWGDPSGATEVSSIAELRLQAADGITAYHLTSEAYLTFQHYNRNKKYIQDPDGQAAIEIDDPTGIITTTYNLYDGITGIKGTLSTYQNLLQFTPIEDPGASTSSGNIVVPQVKTLNELTSADQGKLIQVRKAAFAGSGLFANGISYEINDPDGISVFRTQFYNVDYINTTIPVSLQHITAIVLQYQDIIQISARFLADFQDAGNLPGDANDDGFVNVIDLVWIIAHLNGSTPDGFNYDNADVNGDSVINIADLTALINLILEMSK